MKPYIYTVQQMTLHLYSAFLVILATLSAVQVMLHSAIHTSHPYTVGTVTRGYVRFDILAKYTLHMQPGGAWDQTTSIHISGQPALAPELGRCRFPDRLILYFHIDYRSAQFCCYPDCCLHFLMLILVKDRVPHSRFPSGPTKRYLVT